MLQLIQYLQDSGYLISEIIPDGKIHRFQIEPRDRKSGWYFCYRNYLQRTGEQFYAGKCGSWRSGEEKQFSTLKGIMEKGDRELLDKQFKQAEKQRQKEQEEYWNEIAIEVEQKWNSLCEIGISEYLERKKIVDLKSGIRFDNFNGDIYVPARDADNKLWSVQKITRGGDKCSHPGGRLRGCFHVIGNITDTIYIAEGFATAASIAMATGRGTVCTFGAWNLSQVTNTIQKLYPQKPIIICGDEDKSGTGQKNAQDAARKNSVGIIFPKFKNKESGSDFNDLHCSEGIEEVKRQFEEVKNIPVPIEIISSLDIINTPYPDENEKTFTRKCTIANVAELLKRLGIIVRYNVISKEEEILIPGKSFSIDNQANATFALISSMCERVKIPTGKLTEYLTAIADINPYNPVATWITSEPWDGQSRLKSLYNTIKSKDESLKEVLMRAWLISAVAAAFEPNGVSAHGVLVFQGSQYIGKTMWFKNLVPRELNVLADGMFLSPDDRDSVFQTITKWIVELGELDATLKRDIAQLKAFLTKDKDLIRRPYAKKESNYARRTVFFGSVNETLYLKDPTGNRRFWTVECESIDYNHNIDMQQLWAEIYNLYCTGESWVLSQDCIERLNTHNQQFAQDDPLEERILKEFDWENGYGKRWLTATEVCKDEFKIEKPNQHDLRIVARVLRKLSTVKRLRGYHCYEVPCKKS